jgi:hypothetical protein
MRPATLHGVARGSQGLGEHLATEQPEVAMHFIQAAKEVLLDGLELQYFEQALGPLSLLRVSRHALIV